MEKIPSSLSYETTKAALASGSAQIVTRVLTVVLSVATARALEPREVGVLGLAVIVVGIISMIGYFPETAAVAARGGESNANYAWACTCIRAVVVAGLLLAVAIAFPLIGGYLTGKDDQSVPLRGLISILALGPILEVASGYPRVILQRRLELNVVSAAGLLQPVLFVGLAVVLLWNGYGYLGVVWASVIGTAAATAFLWWCLVRRTGAGWQGWPSPRTLRETLDGAKRVFVGGFGGFLGERVDNLLVSGTIGPTAMSFYSMAWNGSRTAANVFGTTIGFVLIPTLARIQDEPARVQRAIRESLRHSYLLLAPVCSVLFVCAPVLVTYVLGAKWLPLVPCLRIMCITVLAIPILHACNALLVGSGRAHLTGISTTVHLVALAILIPLLSRTLFILGAAYADLAATMIMTLTLSCTARLATRQMTWGAMSVIALPIAASSFAGLLSWIAGRYIGHELSRFISQIAVLFASYLFLIVVMGGREVLADLVGLLRGAARRMSVATESGS